MNRNELFSNIQKKNSYLCVGLDTDLSKIPTHLHKSPDPVFEFNKQIIDATVDLCVAYKPNLAFYESLGSKGWDSLAKTVEYIPEDIFTIADAKRGDIGNTAKKYAEAFFEQMNFDSVTLAPYMGRDSIDPFLSYANKWSIILALTSNASSSDFEELELNSENKLYEQVLQSSKTWGSEDQIMYVVGATKTSALKAIREIVPNHFLLIPGVGAQGGDLKQVSETGMNAKCGLLVNSSRGIIYSSNDEGFAKEARKSALKMQQEMEKCLNDII